VLAIPLLKFRHLSNPIFTTGSCHPNSMFTVQHGIAYTAITATSSAYPEWQKWGCQDFETPQLIDTQGDYVSDITANAKN